MSLDAIFVHRYYVGDFVDVVALSFEKWGGRVVDEADVGKVIDPGS